MSNFVFKDSLGILNTRAKKVFFFVFPVLHGKIIVWNLKLRVKQWNCRAKCKWQCKSPGVTARVEALFVEGVVTCWTCLLIFPITTRTTKKTIMTTCLRASTTATQRHPPARQSRDPLQVDLCFLRNALSARKWTWWKRKEFKYYF